MTPTARLPDWIKPPHPKRPALGRMTPVLRALGVHTVCEQARCPNVGECFGRGVATFLILGECCTRNCAFCAVAHGRPAPPDPEEPARVAAAAAHLGSRHVVITSVTRDDLADGGASYFAATVSQVRNRVPGAAVEVLVPDFAGNPQAVAAVLAAVPEVFGHNVETVPRLYPRVRQGADYQRSLAVLRWAAAHRGGATKSGLMVGLGEKLSEVWETLSDLRAAGVDMVTVGQYLQPSPAQLPVTRYVPPATFRRIASRALALGFREVSAAPLVRSSYHAGEMLEPRLP